MHSGLAEGDLPSSRCVLTSRNLPSRIGVLIILCLTFLAVEAFGQSAQPAPQVSTQSAGQRDLSQASLEDLMNIRVTSVSRAEQKMSRAAAAIFVITQEDIQRSGAANIPDLLRMVPIQGTFQCIVPLYNDMWVRGVPRGSAHWPLLT